jgi:Endonuclease/Exonuclease/phosphatase family
VTRVGRKPAVLLSAIALLALAIPAAADAKKKGEKPKITVMTRNVFLGADLSPALEADTLPEAIDASGVILNEVDSTRFQDRAVPLAREIKKSKADLVGLQEVALFQDQTPSDLGAPPTGIGDPATNVRYDFLALLRQELKDIGAKYRVVISQDEFEEELPADTDQNDATGGVAGADLDARLTMRDVILAKKGGKVKLGRTAGAHYTDMFLADVGGIDIPVERGWVSVEAKVGGGGGKGKNRAAAAKKGRPSKFRFVNTHLEAFGDPTIREAQAKELIAGPLTTNKQVVLVGDINSGLPDPHNVGNLPGQDPNDPLAFQALVGAGFKDNGAVQSCCYSDMFDETQVFDHTVDHVLTQPGLKSRKERVTGDEVSKRTPSDLWPSDHGGVVSRLTLKK